MNQKVFIYDPTSSDKQSAVRGIGRYLQILKENFPQFTYGSGMPEPYDVFINPFFNFLQKPLTLCRIARKQIAIIHDLIPLKYPSHFPPGIKGSIYILLNKLALKNYDLIITDSEASKTDIIDKLQVPSYKIKVIYPCLPKNFTNLEFKIQNSELNSKFSILDSKFCLYVGDATWNKNLVNLARAIKIANVTCVFVGKVFENNDSGVVVNTPPQNDAHPAEAPAKRVILASERSERVQNLNHPWQKEFKQFINETKDDKRFIFAGFVPDSELIKLYKQASLNILPSRDEGFGFSYLEASNFSCPSLLSDIPVLQEISAGNAIFADPNNPQNITDKIKEITSNKNLRNKIGTDAKKRSGFFTPEKFKKEFLKII